MKSTKRNIMALRNKIKSLMLLFVVALGVSVQAEV